MAIQLVTDQLSNVLDDTLRSQLVGNFKAIEKALNDLDGAQAELNSDQDKINQDFKNIKDDNKTRDANVQAIVNILSDYDVPIAIVNGKVVETEEGE
ncbi:hypothetical protein [Lactiplantibacillus pentosus]|uniref:hypothetical protein n=1 Tax=Lactiplantibacillus pentosus TaxID=1589 RepID=UPI000704C77E|nr:hypothetical protein [Lactiplantibacillus pentosus]TDG92014.1 hypothetical protein C5L29_002460 [Lactiplantibacillus pentosus]UZO87552.1 hypothetical protein HPK28_11180 [Lactiplantibacillus pentosus]WKF74946.1 hypothetical protein QYC20_11205 [Lactiplantibacillus pentosus]WKG36827.1 hypothetical protein QYC21_11195 [Lactiplantibacillus pentosus]GEO49837.1 hypothetical protein LPE01_11980 [Lactiplantibacillus pentosus]